MKRKVFALLLVVLMLMALLPTTALADSGNKASHNHTNSVQHIRVEVKRVANGKIYSPSGQSYPRQGETWWFRAVPDAGYKFSHWTYSGNEMPGAMSTSEAGGRKLTISISQQGTAGYWVYPSWRPSTWYYVDADYMNYKAQAVFVPDTTVYDVTLDLGAGGTFDSNGSSTIVVSGQRNDTLVVPAFTENPGYDHIGWNDSLNFHSSRTIGSKYNYQVTFAGNAQVTITGGSPAWTSNGSVAAASYTVASGFRFDGWDRSLSGITAPCTITAKPAVAQGTISLEHTSGGELYGESRTEGTYDNGTRVRLGYKHYDPSACRIDANHGWRIRGWKVGDTDEILPWDATVTVNGNQTYTAVFYDAEKLRTKAGSNGSVNPALDTWEYARGDEINLNTVSTPSADYGYQFDKWIETDYFDNKQRDVALVGGEPIITMGDSNYFKALFKVAEYTVTFKNKLGETLGTETVLHDGDVTKTAAELAYDSGEYPVGSGWDASEGQGIVSNKTIIVNTKYDVTFDLDGGTRTGGGDLNQQVEYGGMATAPVVNPPADAQHTGWDKPLGPITQAQTITAKYEYLVEFVDDAGNVLESEYVAKGADAQTTPGSISLGSGKRFKNAPAWDPALGQNITAPKQILVELEYEVTFDLDGGSRTGGGELTQWVAYGGGATAPVFDDPADANFVEWDKAFDNITEPTTVTAVYEYLVEFKDEDGNVLTSEYVKDGGDAVTTEGDITLDPGKRFKNDPAWDASEGQGITAPTVITVELEYEVTLNLDGGTRTGGGELVQWIAYGGAVVEPTFDAPTGKSFNSWDKPLGQITEPQTITALYDDIDYTLTINYLDRADNSVLEAQYTGTYHYEDAYSVASPAVLGYDLPSIPTVAGNMPADDVTVNVYYDAHTFNLTYMQGSDDAPTDLREYRIYHKDTVSEEYPVTMGYKLSTETYPADVKTIGDITFNNNEANRFTDQFLFYTTPIGIAPVGETVIIYWLDEDDSTWIQANTKAGSTLYQAMYDANSGEFSDASIVKFDYGYAGWSLVAPDQPTKEGYTFVGWDIDGDGVITIADDENGDGLYDGADIEALTFSSNITIKAMYEMNTYEVKFFDDDGTQIGATQIVDWNTAATAPADPEKEGHTFAGWDTAFDAVKSDLDVTATYTINTFEVKFFDDDGTQIGDTQIIDWNTAATAPEDPDKLGHTFAGWDTAFDAVKADLDVTATYTRNSYVVTFVDHDGTVLKTQRVLWRDAATAPAEEDIPDREGFEFDGWDKEFDRVVSYMTVTAQYKEIEAEPQAEPEAVEYLVQFFDADGNLLSEQTVALNGAAEAPEAPEREGFEFAGWDTEFDDVTEDLIITALYTQIVPETETIEEEPVAGADLDVADRSGAFPWWWIVIGAGAAAILLLIFFFVKRKKDEEEEAAK